MYRTTAPHHSGHGDSIQDGSQQDRASFPSADEQHLLLLELKLEKDAFWGYLDADTEIEFLLFLQPAVPAALAIIYGFTCILAAYFEFVIGFDIIGTSHNYARAATSLFIPATGMMAVAQLVLYVLNKKSKSIPIATLLTVSDGLLALFAILSCLFENALIVFVYPSRDCDSTALIETESERVYGDANCHRWIPPFGVFVLTLMVLRRQRFTHCIGVTAINTMHLIIVALAFDTSQKVRGIRWMAVFYTTAMSVFACFVRRQLEIAERSYFEAQLHLQSNLSRLAVRNMELAVFMRSLVPKVVIDRFSSGKRTRGVDASPNAVLLAIGIDDFSYQIESLLPSELVSLVEKTFRLITHAVTSRGMHRIRVSHDDLIFCGNVFEECDKHMCANAACDMALRLVRVRDDLPPLHAAIHVGPVHGGFVGKSWVRYDVFGEGITVIRSALLHAAENAAVVTEEVVTLLGSEVHCSESVTMAVAPEQPLAVSRQVHVLSSIDSPPVHDQDSALVVHNASSSEDNSASNSQTNPTSSRRGSVTQLQQLVELNRDATEIETVSDKFELIPKWFFFVVFADEELEGQFLERRMQAMTRRAVGIYLAFAWVQLILVILLFVDFFPEVNGFVSLALLGIATCMSMAIAAVPATRGPKKMLALHSPWSMASLVAPLFTTYACAAARPSTIGNDTRALLVIAALVRAPSFYHARHQLIAIPGFLIVSQLQVLLPGGFYSSPTLVAWLMVLYTIATDNRNDQALRRHFITEMRAKAVLETMEREEELREGLLRGTLPRPVFEAWLIDALAINKVEKLSVQDMMAVSVQWRQPSGATAGTKTSNTLKSTTDNLAAIERMADRSQALSIVKMLGDIVILVNPVLAFRRGRASAYDTPLLPIFAALQELSDSNPTFSVMADIDNGTQLISTTGMPSFTASGVVMTRMLAVCAADVRVSGVAVMERICAQLHEMRVFEQLGVVDEMQPPLRIRGVGMLRLVKLVKRLATTSESS